jgi:hypothetical protein
MATVRLACQLILVYLRHPQRLLAARATASA